MPPFRPAARALAVLLAVSLVAAVPPASAQEKVPVPGSDRFRIRYADGLLTINDWCPVAKRAIGRSQTPIYVNGRPVGFC